MRCGVGCSEHLVARSVLSEAPALLSARTMCSELQLASQVHGGGFAPLQQRLTWTYLCCFTYFELPMKEAYLKLQMVFIKYLIILFLLLLPYITSLKFDTCYVLTAEMLASSESCSWMNIHAVCSGSGVNKHQINVPRAPHHCLLHTQVMILSLVNCPTVWKSSLQIQGDRQNSSKAQCATHCIARRATSCLRYLIYIYSKETVMEKWQSGEDFNLYPLLA